ncbi:Adenylate cyclase [Sulfitobacter indolifex]|uniref:Adenylyl cyclase class-3/4/guanylyl cyclase n=2 Tax=Sulfitobacter indolifex TaxID=225422 RepID=A0ABP2D9T3_9RHOB|nr:Adenylyl cyclase class-3/4/guanylyl cyclase [Sulfitobacter indolifex HEL-45]UOA19331.1 Adenylate cyclase [Sulfitobacter indolifex]
MFLVFLIWDYSLVPHLAEYFIPLRFVYFFVTVIGFFIFLHIKPSFLVGHFLTVPVGMLSVAITEYLVSIYGLSTYSAVTGPVLIIFVGTTLFLLTPLQTLMLTFGVFGLRLGNLVYLDAEFITFFTSVYYIGLSGFTALFFSVLAQHLMSEVYRSKIAQVEQIRGTEALLLRILPEHVLEEFRKSGEHVAAGRTDASVFFADLVGFTNLTEKVSPGHLIELISELFGQIDRDAKRLGITRVKTIGDSYMAASGLTGEGIAEIIKMLKFATCVRDTVASFSASHGLELGVRIGVATGSAVTGVLSSEYLTFDVWGDTVNLASRLESSCPVGRIQISEATFWRIRSDFRLDALQSVELKSFGERQTYVFEDDFYVPESVLEKYGVN